MTYAEYKAKRDSLVNAAQTLIDEGKLEDADTKMKEAEELDAEWDQTSKALANLRALSGNARKQDVSNPGMNPKPTETIDSTNAKLEDGQAEITADTAYKTKQYTTAWAKKMMGQKLSDQENQVFEMANAAYLHTTENTMVIPETVTSGIWEEAAELYPYWNDITKTYVNGILTMMQDDGSTDAAWYDEDIETEDGKEGIKNYTLSGCELSRLVRVSWKLKEMSVEDFIPYIQRKMARKMGAALGYGVTNGKGKPGNDETFKPEPLGTVTALKKEANTPQVVTYKKGSMDYSHITSARALIKSGYAAGLAVYANNTTIWKDIANIKDGNGRPIFVPDPAAGGAYRLLGIPIKEDGSMSDGDVLFSNAASGYQANVNKQMTVIPDDHVKSRTTDYCGYAIVDGAPITTKAHALITCETDSSTTETETT